MERHHINEVHMSIAIIPPISYVLQLSTLAGCTTEDYVSIFILTLMVLQEKMLPTNNKLDLLINISAPSLTT